MKKHGQAYYFILSCFLIIVGVFVFGGVKAYLDGRKSFDGFMFVESKTERDGGIISKMDIYVTTGEVNLNSLYNMCQFKKRNMSSIWYYLVVFDSEASARFPNIPFGSHYGTDENALRHIKAYYTYNRHNGFSELQVYEKNNWESRAQTFTVQ
jgi:hypothetical protein